MRKTPRPKSTSTPPVKEIQEYIIEREGDVEGLSIRQPYFKELAMLSRINTHAFGLYLYYLEASERTGRRRAVVSNEDAAKYLVCSTKSIERARKVLKARGILSVRRNKKGRNFTYDTLFLKLPRRWSGDSNPFLFLPKISTKKGVHPTNQSDGNLHPTNPSDTPTGLKKETKDKRKDYTSGDKSPDPCVLNDNSDKKKSPVKVKYSNHHYNFSMRFLKKAKDTFKSLPATHASAASAVRCAEELRKLEEIDRYDWSSVRKVVMWALTPGAGFWYGKVRTCSNLRGKFGNGEQRFASLFQQYEEYHSTDEKYPTNKSAVKEVPKPELSTEGERLLEEYFADDLCDAKKKNRIYQNVEKLRADFENWIRPLFYYEGNSITYDFKSFFVLYIRNLEGAKWFLEKRGPWIFEPDCSYYNAMLTNCTGSLATEEYTMAQRIREKGTPKEEFVLNRRRESVGKVVAKMEETSRRIKKRQAERKRNA